MSLADDVTAEVRRRMRAVDPPLSGRALADAAGIPPTLVHRTLAGERALTLDELDAVARVLGIQPEWLLRQGRIHAPRSGDVQK